MKNDLSKLESILGYCFKNQQLLVRALTHSSAGENNYEKLEFLGDSLLSYYITNHIFNYVSNLKVGGMSQARSNLVSTTYLNFIVEKSGISEFVIFGDSLKNNTTNTKNILADVFESLLAAIYIDGGSEKAERFVNKFILSNFYEHIVLDYKTKLQELVQKHYNGTKIEYRELEHYGPSHDVTFIIGLFLDNIKKAEAQGKTKKEAEQSCAKMVFEMLTMELKNN